MEVTIWSLLGEDASGSITVNVPSAITGGDLMRIYCMQKGIDVQSDYILCGRDNSIVDASKSLEEEKIRTGDTLMLTRAEKKEALYSFGSWWMVTSLTFLIGLVGLGYAGLLFFGSINIPKKHGIVIDAGSTHSHLFLFSWYKNEIANTDDVKIIHECHMPGGIAQYATIPGDITDYFKPCLKEAESLIPISARPKTPLILGATAGMRILREYDPHGAEVVLSMVRQVFMDETSFKTKVKDVFIVSGEQEGIDGWTAVNYLFKTFEQEQHQDVYLSALDLGGASVQVSTALKKPGKWPTYDFSIFNETYSVCSTSFLCYGIMKAHYRYEYLLVKQSESVSKTLENPCLPIGITTIFTKNDKREPCILSKKAQLQNLTYRRAGRKEWKHVVKYESVHLQQHLPRNWQVESVNGSPSDVLHTFQGVSDAALCRKRVKALFNYKLCQKTFVFGDCLSHKRVPPYSGELVGFSSVFFRILPLIGINTDNTLEEFEQAVITICSLSSAQLHEKHPSLPVALHEDICFDVMYVFSLLTEGLGVTAEKWKSIVFARQVEHQDVVWALGLMLNRTSMSTPPNVRQLIDFAPSILLMFLFLTCLFTSACFLFNSIQVKRKGSSYQRVLNEYLEKENAPV